MTFANAHILCRLGGSFGVADTSKMDFWSVGLRFAIVGADVPYSSTNLLTFANAVKAAAVTMHTSNLFGAGDACWLQDVTAARVGTDGHYQPDTQETIHATPPPNSLGGGSTTKPWNTALVISLRTDRPRGYASNGRVYYPALGVPGFTLGTGRISDAAVGSRMDVAKVFLDECNTAAAAYATNMRLAVMSQKGAGLTALVTAIRADGRLDSIERRENKIPVTYMTRALS